MKRSLREILPEYVGKHVKIGFKSGSGFVFCNLVTEYSEEEIQLLQEKYHEEATEYLEKMRDKLSYLERIGQDEWVRRTCKMFAKKKKSKAEDEYKRTVFNLKKNIALYNELLKNHDLYLGAYYVEEYKSTDPMSEGTIIILLEGSISGDYWFEEEYLGTPLPSFASLNITDRAYHALAAAVVEQAANDLPSWEAEDFFTNPDRFNMFMPSYDGESILAQLKKNLKESRGKRWYADKKSRKVLEDTIAFEL